MGVSPKTPTYSPVQSVQSTGSQGSSRSRPKTGICGHQNCRDLIIHRLFLRIGKAPYVAGDFPFASTVRNSYCGSSKEAINGSPYMRNCDRLKGYLKRNSAIPFRSTPLLTAIGSSVFFGRIPYACWRPTASQKISVRRAFVGVESPASHPILKPKFHA